MMRCTPLIGVELRPAIATSSSVPGLNRPPMPTYRPSVFSRKTTKLTSARAATLERTQTLVEQPDRDDS